MTDLYSRFRAVRQVISFLIVGFLSNLFGYFLYLVLTYVGVEPKLTMSILYFVGAWIGYFGNKKLTFGGVSGQDCAVYRYVVVQVSGYLINFGMLVYFVGRLGIGHQYVQAAAVIVVALFLFVSLKYYVFVEDKSRIVK